MLPFRFNLIFVVALQVFVTNIMFRSCKFIVLCKSQFS